MKPMLFDLHVHTTFSSCSQLGPGELLETARAKGLDGVCVTDHDTMAIRHELREGVQSDGLCVIFGMEYTTDDGDFLLFGPFEKLEPGLDASKLLMMVNQSGGMAIAAHPFRKNRQTSEYVVEQGLCKVIEAVNGRNNNNENHRAKAWSDRYQVNSVGGSDAHNVDELGKIVTRFGGPITSRPELVSALKNGAFSLAY